MPDFQTISVILLAGMIIGFIIGVACWGYFEKPDREHFHTTFYKRKENKYLIQHLAMDKLKRSKKVTEN